MREMKHEGGVYMDKQKHYKDGLLHQFQYTKLFVKDSSLSLSTIPRHLSIKSCNMLLIIIWRGQPWWPNCSLYFSAG